MVVTTNDTTHTDGTDVADVTAQSAQASGPSISDADIRHRHTFRDYILSEAEPWHRDHLTRLYELWSQWNTAYWDDHLVPPYILLNNPGIPIAYGSCARVSGFGGKSQILLRPSLLTGTHPHMVSGSGYAAGRFQFVADVLLHEMAHQYHQEITGTNEDSYHGHGLAFAGECNRIGEWLGLPRVRTAKKRGKEAALPSCAQWPSCVRPSGFYAGAYQPAVHDGGATITLPCEPTRFVAALQRSVSEEAFRTIKQAMNAVMSCRPGWQGQDVEVQSDDEKG